MKISVPERIPTAEELAELAFGERSRYKSNKPHDLIFAAMCKKGLKDTDLYAKACAILANRLDGPKKPDRPISRVGWAAWAQERKEDEAPVFEYKVEPPSLPDGQFVLAGIIPTP